MQSIIIINRFFLMATLPLKKQKTKTKLGLRFFNVLDVMKIYEEWTSILLVAKGHTAAFTTYYLRRINSAFPWQQLDD